MDNCKHCGINVSYSVSKFGMCKLCEDIFQREIQILTESKDIINHTKNTSTLLNRCQIALKVLERLKVFEHLELIHPPPAQIMKDIEEKRSEFVSEYWEDYCSELTQKLTRYESLDSVIKKIEETKSLFDKYKVHLNSQKQLNEAEHWVYFLISDHIIGGYNTLVREAKDYEKNGDNKSAVKKLNEALKCFEKTKNYFGEQNQNLDIELKDWITRISTKSI